MRARVHSCFKTALTSSHQRRGCGRFDNLIGSIYDRVGQRTDIVHRVHWLVHSICFIELPNARDIIMVGRWPEHFERDWRDRSIRRLQYNTTYASWIEQQKLPSELHVKCVGRTIVQEKKDSVLLLSCLLTILDHC